MSIYQEILNWSQNRPNYIKDALRRIISSSSITQNDIDELVQLLKKENGQNGITLNPIPLNSTHIPTLSTAGAVYPKIISISNPVNICALYNQGHLNFSSEGLTVVYGNNGSGKSSFSKILKKLCWSRNPSINLKKNVFTPSTNQQKVDFVIEENGSTINFQWTENSPTHPSLSSIFVFDTDCAGIYINSENPTEYKPIGIDVLETLISVLNLISQALTSEIAVYNTSKPAINQSLNLTTTAQWYSSIETYSKSDIDNYIQFDQTNIDRKQELLTLINTQNPQQNIQNLSGLKSRIENYVQQFQRIEGSFSDPIIEEIKGLRVRYESIKHAYSIAANDLKNLNTIEGFGTNPWRTLWEAAKNFAHTSEMSDGQNFPSLGSLEKCVLCQQDLDDIAQERLKGFNQFILNDVSTQLSAVQREIQQKKNLYDSLNVPPYENFKEITQYIQDFPDKYKEFTKSISELKTSLVNYLQNGSEIPINRKILSSTINSLILNIDAQIQQNRGLLQNRNAYITEHNELTVKEFLFNNKTIILRYFDEYKYKIWVNSCQSQLNTSIVSKKIGDLMEDQAVNLQHQEFINHLSYFNRELATRVLLSKTRTSHGSTYQKCSLNGIKDSINSILSEGEQKVVALSNFFAECTIDGRKNSIIFDDPVTSLDMDYRDLIATKIVELSQDRQIVVLTHDLSFLRLLIDTQKSVNLDDCHVIGIDKYNGISGIVTDEIPFLAKNVQERIDSIRRILREHDSLQITDSHGRETKLDSARKRFRMLLERSVEEILSNKTYERFSKNIHLKKGNLSSYIVTEQNDVDLLLQLFGKYSITEHDGGTSTIPLLPGKSVMEQDITDYSNWKDGFKARLKAFQTTYN
ncbi:AAA family ATPase [Paradesertivirga mongoliensis]|uniref:AAA family ATPase n=1 Tax=Paradesertivirga mongoliensis TaxID=2100740 RepID=A0ABW4ZQF0_9SPHI|nr:AAA family ATPase [Pedobacter mongoliensis]